MKLKKLLLLSFLITLFVLAVSCATDDRKGKSFQKNVGLSSTTVNVGGGKIETDADSAVPPKEDLIKNLKRKGYTVTEYGIAPNSDIAAERVWAEKGDLFFDICYGLTAGEQADAVFEIYESIYDENEIYLLADNEGIVYTVSDSKTFKAAGFETLATSGKLYIWE